MRVSVGPPTLELGVNERGQPVGADDIAREIERQVHEQFDRTIEIPDGLDEDQAVRFVVDRYKQMTGVDLDEEDVRAEVREQMNGRDTT